MRIASPSVSWLSGQLCLACSSMANAGSSFFASHAVNQALSVGFGLAEEYDEDWSGRYFIQDASFVGVSLAPSLACRPNEQWSAELGLRAAYGELDSQLAVDDNPLGIGTFADGQLHYRDDDWGGGANLGVIYPPRAGTRIGMSYTTEVDLEFEDRQNFDNLRPALASAGWQECSEFGRVGIELDSDNPNSATVDRQYRDTWHLAIGGQYQATPVLRWQAALAYDGSAFSDRADTFEMPMAESWHLVNGHNYAFDRSAELDFGYAFVWMGGLPVSQNDGGNGRISTSGKSPMPSFTSSAVPLPGDIDRLSKLQEHQHEAFHPCRHRVTVLRAEHL